jgi:hypothetical protein
MERKIHLPECGVKQKLTLPLFQQNRVRHEEYFGIKFVANFDEFMKFGMNQWISHQMKRDLLRKRRDLSDDFTKEIDIDQLLRADDFRTKTALQIADIRNFDMNLVEALAHAAKLTRATGLAKV